MSRLDWPREFDRTPEHERVSGSKFDTNYRQTKRDLKRQMRLLDVEQWRLEDVSGSNGDPGVVVRWKNDGNDHVVACDDYTNKRANIRAIYLWIEETRKRGDRPVKTGGSEFAAARLPPGDNDVVTGSPQTSAHDILEVRPDASPEVVRAAFQARVKEDHPDHGGGEHTVRRLQEARDKMLDAVRRDGTA